MWRKYLPVALLIFVIFFIATSPQGAADVTQALGDGIQSLFGAFAEFLQSLAD